LLGEESSFEEWIEQIIQLNKQIKEDKIVEVRVYVDINKIFFTV